MAGKFHFAICIVLSTAGLVRAGEPFPFPEARHGKGELKYINGVPVLVLTGTPEEMGEQMGMLAVRPAAKAADVFRNVIKEHKLDLVMPLLAVFGKVQMAKYPEEYRREFEAMAKCGGVDRDLLLIGNTFSELRHLAGCSGLMIDAAHSETGGTLMGRNWDFPPIEAMVSYSLVIVYRPIGKRAFAIVNFPGVVASGCASSAMNADGLVIGGNSIDRSADGAPQVAWGNSSTSVLARRILEECSNLDDAEKLIRAYRPAERHAFVACDRSGGAVFEITSRTVVARREKDGICIGTNHFVSKELGIARDAPCLRMTALNKARTMGKLGVDDVAKRMHEANQAAWTLHTMVFEPRTLKLHVAFGDGKNAATTFPLKEIDLSDLLHP